MTSQAHITEAEKNKPRTWLKLHTGMIDEPSIYRVSDRAGLRYFMLTGYAGTIDGNSEVWRANGLLAVPLKDIAFRLRCRAEDLEADLEELAKVGLVEQVGQYWRLTRYQGEQVDILAVREDTKTRVQTYRESKKSAEIEQEKEQDKSRVDKSVRVSNKSVTRYTLVTPHEDARTHEDEGTPEDEGRTDNSILSEKDKLVKHWESINKTELSKVNEAGIIHLLTEARKTNTLKETREDIREKMQKTAINAPNYPENYLNTCLKELAESPRKAKKEMSVYIPD